MTSSTITIRSTDMADSCEEIKRLRARFERHMDEHRSDEHDYIERQLRHDLAQKANTEAIARLTTAVQPLVDGVTAVVVAQKVVKWLTTFAFIGVCVDWLVTHNPFK